MQFYEVIKNRKSIRSFKNTPIERDKLARIIDAAMRSPSWKNNTSYRFILVDDQGEKENLAAAIMNDTDKAANAIKEAPMIAVVVGEPDDSGVIKDQEYYMVDGAIAMEHFVLAATNEGYGTCWIASLDEDTVRRTLNVPNNYRVIAMTPIGETEERKQSKSKKDVREHVFLNQWGAAYTQNDGFSGIH
ncbi:nitroreductase family protein [Crassaminicella profunda]|uniref:nitroreductase family protein n=1 Tax=Crassaminicella profunda TaxID=1286698 RepID=UPI001CA636F8|nr:nitroreductase family protein [Crassaminicella profunda]QZY54861.1 nitroreductase family protein [Crassaminicella profunda]